MKYRILKKQTEYDPPEFMVQYMYKWWPFWITYTMYHPVADSELLYTFSTLNDARQFVYKLRAQNRAEWVEVRF